MENIHEASMSESESRRNELEPLNSSASSTVIIQELTAAMEYLDWYTQMRQVNEEIKSCQFPPRKYNC